MSNNDAVITVDGLSKRYIIGHKRQKDDGIRHAIEDFIRSPLRALFPDRSLQQTEKEEFWALKDVSFSIRRGDVVGVIGRNGAGKSTLLKILSRITEPTSGKIEIQGRIASLLEVGTGFHQELSGRENIFLNGAILGMNRQEIRRKFDEIVAFSEVEQFLDTPVKRYSSGMYVKLAFSVAAHLDPEIMVIDEVLAVGDTAFQQKCLERIRSISNEGKTVLFVSHQLSTVHSLCKKGILLEKGRVAFFGDSSSAIAQYLSHNNSTSGSWRRENKISDPPDLSFHSATIKNSKGTATSEIDGNEVFTLDLELIASKSYANAQVAVRFTNGQGIVAFTSCNTDTTKDFVEIAKGRHSFTLTFDATMFMPGSYTLKIAAHIPQEKLLDLIDDEITFSVHDTGNHINKLKDNRLGILCPVIPWKHQKRT